MPKLKDVSVYYLYRLEIGDVKLFNEWEGPLGYSAS